MPSIFIAILFALAAVQALPALVARDSSSDMPLRTLTTTQIDAFTPYTSFARAAYCNPATTISWSCGAACESNRDFEPISSGGNSDAVQYWYVGYSRTLHTVIAAHQGTNKSNILPLLTDGDLSKKQLDPLQFPGLPSSIEVHKGFRDEHAKTAETILSDVKSAMSKYNTTSVTTVGHSLGAALALLDSIYLFLHLPSNTNLKTIVYGLPRVGNKDFADYVDHELNVTHINHMKDPVPTVPGMFLDYMQTSGEVHIGENENWVACSGRDNPSNLCSVGAVPSVFQSQLSDHDGPYNGIMMRCH